MFASIAIAGCVSLREESMGMTIDGAAAFIDDGKSIASLNAILEPSPIRAIWS